MTRRELFQAIAVALAAPGTVAAANPKANFRPALYVDSVNIGEVQRIELCRDMGPLPDALGIMRRTAFWETYIRAELLTPKAATYVFSGNRVRCKASLSADQVVTFDAVPLLKGAEMEGLGRETWLTIDLELRQAENIVMNYR